MIKLKTSFLIFVLLFSLIACSQIPIVPTTAPTETFTPFVAGTETALADQFASPTPWVAGTETALAVSAAQTQSAVSLPTFPTPTSAPALTEKPTDFSPILYGGKFYQTSFFLLLGGVNRLRWLSPE